MVFGCARSFFLRDLTCMIIPDLLAVVVIVVSVTPCFMVYLFHVPDDNLVFSLSVYMVEAPVEVTQEACSYSGCELALLPISHVQICFDCIGIDDECASE